MVFENCFGAFSSLSLNSQAVMITILLIAAKFGYKHFTKKKLSPIALIVISALIGIILGCFTPH